MISSMRVILSLTETQVYEVHLLAKTHEEPRDIFLLIGFKFIYFFEALISLPRPSLSCA